MQLNKKESGGEFEAIDYTLIATCAINIAQVLFEMLFLITGKIQKVQLEKRIRMGSEDRHADMNALCCLAFMIALVAVPIGLYVPFVKVNQLCRSDQFTREPKHFWNSKNICYDCNKYMPFCTSCSNNSTCTSCADNYFVRESMASQCVQCPSKPNCEACKWEYDASRSADSITCRKCKEGTILKNGECHECGKGISNCKQSTCYDNSEYCTECKEGFYLENNRCKPCSAAIFGCSKCLSKDVCIECQSSFLAVTNNKCQCRSDIKGVV